MKKRCANPSLGEDLKDTILPTFIGMGSYVLTGLLFRNVAKPLHRGLAGTGLVVAEAAVLTSMRSNELVASYLPIAMLGTAVRAPIDLGEATIPESTSGQFAHVIRKSLGLTLQALPGTPVVSLEQHPASVELRVTAPTVSVLQSVKG